MEVEPNESNNDDDSGTEISSARKVRLPKATVLLCYINFICKQNKQILYLSINNKYKGFVVDLAEHIAKIVGFQYEIVPTNGYGSVGKDGRWDGMIRELLEEVIQFIY